VTRPVATGLPGVFMNVGDHICAFYRGDGERDDVLLPYIKVGLESGDRCVCVVDRTDPDQVRAAVGAEGRDEVTLLRSEESYLLGGRFSPNDMLSFWEEAARYAFDEEGFEFLRAAGEMTWALRDLPGVELLVSYEAQLNRFLPKYPQTILCLYDLERFTDGQVLIDILRTHPSVLMSGMVVDNPWYVEPDEFLGQKV
jgi:hypothetical protein